MNTRILTKNDISYACNLLQQGNLLGFPTETVYGLAVNGLDSQAVEKIFQVKGRPADNPLILHVADASWLSRYCCNIYPQVELLTKHFWPGPLTLILDRTNIIPDIVTAGLDTVGVRCPNHPLALDILKIIDVPLAAPSGNLSGKPSPTTARAMFQDMDGKIPAIIDGGDCVVGVESTILDVRSTPRLLRTGGVPVEDLEKVLNTTIEMDPTLSLSHSHETQTPLAPGMKYRHYAPKAPVTVVTGCHSAAWIKHHATASDGVLCFEEYLSFFSHFTTQSLGKEYHFTQQAQSVFSTLRFFDSTNVSQIFAQCPTSQGLGRAVANRLQKAAGFHIVETKDTPFILGITGQTGAGKTTVLQAVKELGGAVIDCDALYWRLLEEDASLIQRLKDEFGDITDANDNIHRKKLGALVFSDPDKLKTLNSITHPVVEKKVQQETQDFLKTGHTIIAIDAIALIESGLSQQCDHIIGVIAPESTRIARIMSRDSISKEYATQRVQAQKNEEFYREHSHFVLENASSNKELFFKDTLEFLISLIQKGD